MHSLQYRKAVFKDLPKIIEMLADDALGQTREKSTPSLDKLDKRYIDAFYRIDADANQYLMIVMQGDKTVGTCHLTFMPSLTHLGSTRMQIEGVRVASAYRGQNIGQWMIQSSVEIARNNNASLVQLTTDKKRPDAIQFYERLGFKTTHEGMKYHV